MKNRLNIIAKCLIKITLNSSDCYIKFSFLMAYNVSSKTTLVQPESYRGTLMSSNFAFEKGMTGLWKATGVYIVVAVDLTLRNCLMKLFSFNGESVTCICHNFVRLESLCLQ